MPWLQHASYRRVGRTRKRTAAHSIPSEDGFDHGDGCVVVGKRPRSKPAQHDSPQGTIGYRSCAQLLVDARSRLDGQTPALRAANPTRKQHRGVEPDRCTVSTSPRTSKGQLLYSIGKPQATFIFSFLQEGDLVRWAPWSRFLHAHVRCAAAALSPKAPALPVLQVHLLNGHITATEQQLRAKFTPCTTKGPIKLVLHFGTILPTRFRASLVRWYSGHLTSRNFT